jgi:hypothetical protein
MYKIIVWHNDSVNGIHQSVLFDAKTMGKVLRDFDKYLTERKPEYRGFSDKNLIQLHHVERGVLGHFPASLRG